MSVLAVSPEVAAALATGRPVVALESAITTHGLPPPHHLETARAMETAVREAGAVPATVAILDGVARVGLSADQLRRLADHPAREKASVRDLARLVALGGTAGTTVAATLRIAHRAGIRVMATGGIGGVHRGAAGDLDISADLAELVRSPLVVVCSGIKAVLDVPRTLELLETLGIPVLGLGTDRLPGFYLRALPHPVPRLADPAAAVRLVRAQAAWGWPTGLLLTVPPPADLALDPAEFEALLAAALAEARRCGVRGPEETPFLLAQLASASGGRTVALNRALAVANARIAGTLAAALAVAP